MPEGSPGKNLFLTLEGRGCNLSLLKLIDIGLWRIGTEWFEQMNPTSGSLEPVEGLGLLSVWGRSMRNCCCVTTFLKKNMIII